MAQNNQPRAGLPVWWIVSIAFHAVLLTWLLCFSPVKVIDLSKKTATASVSPSRAKEIMSKISEKQAENLSASVRELQDMQQQLAELANRKREEFAKSAAQTAKDAPAQTEQAQAAAAQAQTEALAAQARVDTVISNALQTRVDADLKQLDALQKESAAAQARATEAQHQALDKLAVSDKRFSEAYQAQADANAAQERATRAQDVARAVRDESNSSKTREAQAKVASVSNALTQAQKDFSETSTELGALTNSLFNAEAALLQMETNSPQGLKKFADAQKKADSIRQKITHRSGQLEKYAGRIKDQGARLKLAQAEAAGLAPATSNEQMVALQTEAQQRQREAQQAQARAREQFAAVKNLPAPAEGGIAALPKPAESSPVLPKPAGQTEKMDLPKLYDTALKTEDALTESYRRLRATELAMIRQVPLARAMELTDSAKVDRPQLQSSLTNSADMEAAREAMQSARAEINAMHQLASSLLAQAREMDRSASRSAAGVSASSENLQSAISRAQSLESLAAEDENARAKDLTLAMKRSGGATKSGSGSGGKAKSSGSGAGKPGSGGGAGVGGTGAGSGGAGGSGAGSLGGGSGLGSGGMGGGGSGGSGGMGDGVGSSVPAGVSGDIAAMPGRTVAARGESARWMFVDSWYILGPFDNPGRANIEKQFPPETIVDRSAIYDGKGGSQLKWEFHQAHEAKVVPPFRGYNAAGKRDLQYVIYYAATELYFEEACDLWVAIGSDDFSKVWINDQLIWASGKKTKSWRVDEGMRRVHFVKGVNRVLYRVENAHGQTEFSFVVGMP
ncbi:MAG: hypothetical protein U1F65_11510 [Verrucomicrobiota bacterium]